MIYRNIHTRALGDAQVILTIDVSLCEEAAERGPNDPAAGMVQTVDEYHRLHVEISGEYHDAIGARSGTIHTYETHEPARIDALLAFWLGPDYEDTIDWSDMAEVGR